jgi:small-conductance mechanosensitive channel
VLDKLRPYFARLPVGETSDWESRVLSRLDPNQLGYVSLKSTRRFAEDAFSDRVLLSVTLQDAAKVVGSIDFLISGLYLFLAVLITILIHNVSLTTSITTIVSAMLTFSFVFGNTFKESFESLVFIFSVHQYDVGDWIEFNGNIYRVLRIRTLATDFIDVDGNFLRIENSRLRGYQIINRNMSQNNERSLKFALPIRHVSQTLVENLTDEINRFAKENPADFDYISFMLRDLMLPGTTTPAMVNYRQLVICNIRLAFARSSQFAGLNYSSQAKFLGFLATLFQKYDLGEPTQLSKANPIP